MNLRGLGRAAGLLALIFAAVGALVGLLAAVFAGAQPEGLVAVAILTAALGFAGALIAVVAAVAEWWLRDRLSDDDARLTWAATIAAGLVLASGLMSVGSLGLLAFAVTAVLALLTQQVLYRTLR